MINQTRNRNESERIASRREGRKKYHGKNQVRPPVGEKNSRSGVGGGGRGWGWSVDAGGGRWAGDACANLPPAAGARRAAGGHTPSGTVARRSSPVSPSAPYSAPPPLLSRRRRPAPRDQTLACPLLRYMSKVLNSVLPIASATVHPQPFFETDPTCTSFRVSTDIRVRK